MLAVFEEDAIFSGFDSSDRLRRTSAVLINKTRCLLMRTLFRADGRLVDLRLVKVGEKIITTCRIRSKLFKLLSVFVKKPISVA